VGLQSSVFPSSPHILNPARRFLLPDSRVEGLRFVVANGSGKVGDQVLQATYSDLYNATTSGW